MSASTQEAPPSEVNFQLGSANSLTRWLRAAVRFLLATIASATICIIAFRRLVPKELAGPIDVVGYPAFANFNFEPPFLQYRLTAFAFPVLALLIYILLALRGPLRVVRPQTDRAALLKPLPPLSAEIPRNTVFWIGGVLARIAVPTAVVVIAAACRNGFIGKFAFACGLAFAVTILISSIIWALLANRGKAEWKTGLRNRIAMANGVGSSAAALLGLWYVSENTVVFGPNGWEHWTWLPWWLAGLIFAAILIWTWRQVRLRTPAIKIERSLLIAIVGPVALFLGTSSLPGAITAYAGFDDGQQLAGGALLAKGYFPWRDLLFIHGFLPDVLSGSIGFVVFGDSVWGTFAVTSALLIPLGWVSVYYFTAWVSRGNPWFLALVTVAAIGGLLPMPYFRFIFYPIILILLGETIRRQSKPWTTGLVLSLFVQAVLAPETSFFVIPAVGTIVLADLVHRQPGTGLWTAFRRTRWMIVAGLIIVVMFGVWLAANGALQPFADYYAVFGPGHNATGAMPPTLVFTKQYIFFYTGTAAVLATIWLTIARIGRKGAWDVRDWVIVAAAGFVSLYQEKALGRFDGAHVEQVFCITLPLVLLLLWKLLSQAEKLTLVKMRMAPVPVANLLAGSLLAVYLVSLGDIRSTVREVPKKHRADASAAAPTSFARMGYVTATGVDQDMLRDLDTVLRTYADDDAPVFDMTNSLGYLYYVLGREPGTRFAHVSMAVTPFAQQLLIEELKRSRPPVVIFESTKMGLPEWDGPRNNVRHYQVSDYLLDEFVPVLSTHGNLVMVRRDLAGQRPIPNLIEPPLTKDLWFSTPACAWGAVPNFLPAEPQGQSVSLPVRQLGERLVVDISGPATASDGQLAQAVVLMAGSQVLRVITPSSDKFQLAAVLSADESERAQRLGMSVSLRTSDGRLHPANGLVDRTARKNVSEIENPNRVKFADYALATITTGGGPFTAGDFAITDTAGHSITASSLGNTSNLAIRVGSCLQWRGYDPAGSLYVLQGSNVPVTAVTLSGVRD